MQRIDKRRDKLLPVSRWPTREEAVASGLFSPIRLGPIELNERTWVPAMVPWRATEDGFVTPEVLQWYQRFAQGQPGALVVEATGIRDIPSGPLLRVGHDRYIGGLRKLVETVREASGSSTFPRFAAALPRKTFSAAISSSTSLTAGGSVSFCKTRPGSVHRIRRYENGCSHSRRSKSHNFFAPEISKATASAIASGLPTSIGPIFEICPQRFQGCSPMPRSGARKQASTASSFTLPTLTRWRASSRRSTRARTDTAVLARIELDFHWKSTRPCAKNFRAPWSLGAAS